jgi:hypothetical protein
MSDLIPPVMPDDLDALIQAMERVQQLEAEVAKLRLTDEERAFLELHTQRLVGWSRSSDESKKELLAVRGLLERTK